MKRIVALLVFSGVLWGISSAADLSGLWVIKQSKGIVQVTPKEGEYTFVKESYFRGEKETRKGVIRIDGASLSFQYSLSLTTSGSLENPDWIIENSIEDWIRVRKGEGETSFDLTGTWTFLDSVVEIRQDGTRLTGIQKRNDEAIAEFEGFVDGRLISLKVIRQPKRIYPVFLELVILEKNKLLYSWGYVEDTHWNRKL
jgi:hypothetical protein